MRRTLKTSSALVLALTLLACDSPPSEVFAVASVEGAHAMSDGIAFARMMRAQGKTTPEANLKRARIARAVVTIHITSINLALDAGTEGVEAAALSAQADALTREAERLLDEASADLAKTEKGALIDFGAGVILRRVRGLSSKFGDKPGVRIEITAKAREGLKEAKALAEQNGKDLDAAIKALSGEN